VELVKIVEFTDEYGPYFKALNVTWIEKFFELEEQDVYTLSHPKESILQKGGHILFARINETIVGTCSLRPIDKETIELGKMAVNESYQGLGIGKMLLKAAIQKARSGNFKRLTLYSNTTLTAAIALYTTMGFRPIPKNDFHSKRSNIKMVLDL
jgi:GNAT superfamily N-acetyltransferase